MPVTLSDAELLGEATGPIAAGTPTAAYDIVFLDRDGTLNVHRPGYVADPARLVLLPGAARAVARLNAAGCRVVLVTNQRGIATGRLTRAGLLLVHRTLVAQLAAQGAHLDALQVCPHDVGTCTCRKPAPGLFETALRRATWASPARCAMVGDQPSDILPAAELGMTTVLLGEGTASLAAAVQRLL
ncbi:D-glycero-alpha-D-manno-heptose-1,7-bisphosphate 7-phosphatase [Rudaeicoccus suwonensis]|uniref:D,D-heptose 1,7-bisphosphate phosphatase n=1 Tax=Rudaeicoccus suwonensis TaxID=657409 RepID=A0A561EAJ9_9MICO|nr:HAD-IIIA family hydrolase [Rudaeicoccus suwonensis]TWE12640.1 D-glycero-D-manno-heptose 1,7-bisphosphate phosphatase [Rudaeicoccus suwonensis]